MSTRYEVKTPRPQKDGKTFWHRVGTAFRDGEDVTVYLDSSPYPDSDGRVVLKLWEPRDRDTAHKANLNRGQQGRSYEIGSGEPIYDDSGVPF